MAVAMGVVGTSMAVRSRGIFSVTRRKMVAARRSVMIHAVITDLWGSLGTMFGPQQIEDGLDRIEGLRRDLHEYGVPVGHGAVPQAR